MKKIVVESSKLILDDFFKVEEAQVTFERTDGTMSPVVRKLNFQRGDCVAVLIFNTDNQTFILCKQFRYPTLAKTGNPYILEIPAGKIDDGETPYQAAIREVREETGLSCKDLTHVQTFFLSPGGSSERMFLYYADVMNEDHTSIGGGLADENEDIEIVNVSFQQFKDLVKSGSIIDAKTLLAYYWNAHL